MKKLFVLFLLLFLTGCGYDVYEMPEDVYINLNENKFPVYEEHTSMELVNDTNAEILSEDTKLKNDLVGEYIYTLDYKYKKRKYKYDITYNVVDITAPVFIGASNSLTTLLNDETDICSKIVYGDDYDNKPECEIIGEYDINAIGVYKDLEYVIRDSSNNENKKTFTLNVVSKLPSGGSISRPKYLYMNEILNNYKNDNTSIGIDISKWQGNVDFEKVKNAGIEFVIMRIGVQSDPSESLDLDVRFKEYYKKAKEVGLKVSVYVYNTAISYEDGVNTAKWVINELNGDKLDLPIAYDWENWKSFNEYGVSLHTLSQGYLGFEKTLKDAGYEAMLYSSKFYLENVWLDYEKSNIWLAHYTSKTDYKGDYMLWQMTSLAKIDGITENTVDIDILYK